MKKIHSILCIIACFAIFSIVACTNKDELKTEIQQESADIQIENTDGGATRRAEAPPTQGPTPLEIALVDGGGALGGAAAVASILNVVSVSNPVGWALLGAGAAIGAAATSIPFARGGAPPRNPIISHDPNNAANAFDYIGDLHNQLVLDYHDQYDEVNAANYYEFIMNNHQTYGIDEVLLDQAYFEEEFAAVSNLNGQDDIMNFIASRLPTSVDANAFVAEMAIILEATTVEDFITRTIDFENRFFAENNLEDAELLAMKSFFSTIRHSVTIW